MNYKKIILIGGFIILGSTSAYITVENQYEKEIVKHTYFSLNHCGSIIAHRGFSSIELENSLNAIEKGLDLKCSDGIEIDVRISKDNEVILSHNNYIGGLGKVEECYYDEIEKVTNKINEIERLKKLKESLNKKDGKLVYNRYNKLCEKEEQIIKLDDVLKYNESKILIIDLKFEDDDYKDLYTKVNEILENYDGDFNIILQSDNYEYLKEMKELYPKYNYQLIIKTKADLDYLDSDFNAYCIRKNLITKKIVKKLYNDDKTISIWTVNSYEDFNILYNKLEDYIMNVNIITDYPDEMCYLLTDKKIKKLNK